MNILSSFRAILVGFFLALALSVSAPVASAGDPVIDAAKAAGIVGERADGYLGLVTGDAEANVRRKVTEINAKRRVVYERLAEQSGTTVETVGVLTGEKQFAQTVSGHFLMGADGRWTRKP
ncbi:MAG: YdbL family protein [Hyphomonadaceae bacterium]